MRDLEAELDPVARLLSRRDRHSDGIPGGNVDGGDDGVVRLVLEVDRYLQLGAGRFRIPAQSLRSSSTLLGSLGISSPLPRPCAEFDRHRALRGHRALRADIVPFILRPGPGSGRTFSLEFDGNKLHGLAVHRQSHHDKTRSPVRGKAHTGDPLRFRVLREVKRDPDLAIVYR